MPETIRLPTPLKVPEPRGRPLWISVVALALIALVICMVTVTVAIGTRTFIGVGSVFPILLIVGVLSMLVGWTVSSPQMSQAKMDLLRARYMFTLDTIRETAASAGDKMDENYRWYHPPPATLAAAVGSAPMWERKPGGNDRHFGVVRVGVGMIDLQKANVVTWNGPRDMPAEIDMDPVSGKALEEFVRHQSVAYGVPSLISLLAEPGYALRGSREQVLALMRAVVCQLAFSHGPDHLEMMVVTSDVAAWDWVKWLPHFGCKAQVDAAGPARMVYQSVAEFRDAHGEIFEERAQFMVRPGCDESPAPVPHVVIIADSIDAPWNYVTNGDGTDGITFFDLTGSSVPACLTPSRIIRFDDTGAIGMLPRDPITFAVEKDPRPAFFALADQIPVGEAEQFAFRMAGWRLAGAEEPGQDTEGSAGALDILSYYRVDDVAAIDCEKLWADRREPNAQSWLRVPFANRADNGELMLLDIGDCTDGGHGPHGVIVGTTRSGKNALVRTVLLSIMLGHRPDAVQLVLADPTAGSAIKPFAGLPHVSHVITDLEKDPALMDRLVDAMWGEVARRKAICDKAGAEGAAEYNMRRGALTSGEQTPPLPVLVVMIDEFAEWLRVQPTAAETVEQIARQGQKYWVHLLLASQKLEGRGMERLLESLEYRLALKTDNESAAAIGIAQAQHLPNKSGQGYFKVGIDADSDVVRFQAEDMWREYCRPDDVDYKAIAIASRAEYIRPQLFSTAFTPIDIKIIGEEPDDLAHEGCGDDDGGPITTPKVGPVIIDRLRRIDFEPYRLWQPPLDQPVTVEELVNDCLGRSWQQNYGADANLVFPVGIIDRPFKHDQQPLLVDTSGPGAHVLIVGATGSGKTTALQTLICSAAMTHAPERVQFYCVQFSSPALSTVSALPHVGGLASHTDADYVRRMVAEVHGLMRERERSFAAHAIPSMEAYRRRKFGGEQGAVPDDGFGDVFLAIDNYKAFVDGNEPLVELVNQIILRGHDYGVHVVATVDRVDELRPPVRDGFGSRVELRLLPIEDSALVRPRQANAVPWRAGRGMVAQNYVRSGVDAVGLHTLIARPAEAGSPARVFESDRLAAAVAQRTGPHHRARPVRRLPERVRLETLRTAVSADRREGIGAGGIAWALSDLDLLPVYWNFDESPHFIATGLTGCGRTTLAATVMAEISRVYAPGGSTAAEAAGNAGQEDTRPSAQVWLVDPRRVLLTRLGPKYVARFAYTVDALASMIDDLVTLLGKREPLSSQPAQQKTARSWWGSEIFLIIDDIHRLQSSSDSPLARVAAWVSRATDVGLHVLCTSASKGWSEQVVGDPMLRALVDADTPTVLMSADPIDGPVRGTIRGGPLPVGRGLLITGDVYRYVQVAIDESGRRP